MKPLRLRVPIERTPIPKPNWPELYKQLGLDVTICLAAVCEESEHIVTVSDRRISFSDSAQAQDDAALKARQISKKWGVLFAGNVGARALGIIDQMRAWMTSEGQMETSAEVQAAVLKAYRAAFQRYAAEEFLTRYGWKRVEDFKNEGLEKFGEALFNETIKRIDSFDVGVEFLVYGFDPGSGGHIFEVKNPGVIESHDILGFGVIGSGFWPAFASLTSRPLSRLPLTTTVYRLLEAKFCAETASGVGLATTVIAMTPDFRFRGLVQGDVDKIRDIWKAARDAPIPSGAGEIITAKFQKLMSPNE